MINPRLSACAALVLSLGTPAMVRAQDVPTDAPADLRLSGTIGLVSDYRFRGLSRSDGAAAAQAGVTLDHASGAYAGVWASSLAGGAVHGSQELDLYLGYSGEVAPGLKLDGGLQYYAFPGGHAGRAEFFEPYLSLNTTYGPATVRLGANYAWAQAAIGADDNVYLHGRADLAVPGTPLTITAHAGYQDGALAGPVLGVPARRRGWDYALSATATLRGRITLGLNWIATSGPAEDRRSDDQVVGSLSVAF